jgi:hypothetical protein
LLFSARQTIKPQQSGRLARPQIVNIILPEVIPQMTVALFLVACAAIGALLLVAWGTVNRNRWGVNFGKLLCPRCLRRIPRPQGPPSLRQILFGGGTCSECHTVVDKWGRERMPGHRYRVSAKN